MLIGGINISFRAGYYIVEGKESVIVDEDLSYMYNVKDCKNKIIYELFKLSLILFLISYLSLLIMIIADAYYIVTSIVSFVILSLAMLLALFSLQRKYIIRVKVGEYRMKGKFTNFSTFDYVIKELELLKLLRKNHLEISRI